MFRTVLKELVSSMAHFNSVFAAKAAMTQRETLCKASTQDFKIRKHVGPLCTRRKVFDDMKSQESKTVEELVADELCNAHKKIKERFMHIIIF